MGSHDERLPDDVLELADWLREHRPQASPAELDGIKVRALTRGSQRNSYGFGQKGLIMRSRFALTIMIAVGMLMSGGGAALAVSGLSATGSAAVAQYGAPGGVLGVGGNGGHPGGANVIGGNGGHPGGANVIGGSVSSPQSTVQAPRQVAASAAGGGLPFTGYAAIPVLLIGLGLLVAGVMLRSRAPRRGL